MVDLAAKTRKATVQNGRSGLLDRASSLCDSVLSSFLSAIEAVAWSSVFMVQLFQVVFARSDSTRNSR